MKLGLFTIVVFSAALLFGCGDDVTNNVTNISGAKTVADLDVSESCMAGELALNLADSMLYACDDENRWIAVKYEAASSATGSSSSEPRSDSVRVDTVYVDTSANMEIEDKSFSGVSQKGPFLTGSSVVVQELLGKTFMQTGRSFLTSISNDRGEFTFHNVTLASRYAIVQANGYYQRENGGTSKGPLTLNALVDFANRETVNINILTHLEFKRVLNLINDKMTYDKAKKQAEEEILREFGIDGDFGLPEDLDILSSSDGDAVLLALSTLILGRLSDAEFSDRLAHFAEDFADNGKLDELYSRMAKLRMAEMHLDGESYYGMVRSKVLLWNGGKTVAAFEPIIDRYFGVATGFGMCTSENVGEIALDTNWIFNRDTVPVLSFITSTYGYFFVCDSATQTWVRFNNPDSTTTWTAEADGALKQGDSTSMLYKYDQLRAMWVLANPLDSSLGLNGCTKTRDGSSARGVDDQCYLCRAGLWQRDAAAQCS